MNMGSEYWGIAYVENLYFFQGRGEWTHANGNSQKHESGEKKQTLKAQWLTKTMITLIFFTNLSFGQGLVRADISAPQSFSSGLEGRVSESLETLLIHMSDYWSWLQVVTLADTRGVSMWHGLPQSTVAGFWGRTSCWKESARRCIITSTPSPEITQHHLWCLLLARSKALKLVHIQGKRN